jgi:hypothetical protein
VVQFPAGTSSVPLLSRVESGQGADPPSVSFPVRVVEHLPVISVEVQRLQSYCLCLHIPVSLKSDSSSGLCSVSRTSCVFTAIKYYVG